MDAKTRAAASIAQAKVELDRALAEMDAIRSFDPALIGAVTHTLSNSITVTMATVDMLQMTLGNYEDPDVLVWLEGIAHASELMQHAVSRLVSVSAPSDFPLKLEYVNLPVLMERACQYYRRRTETEHVNITCQSVGHVPPVWADRVAVAIVADNLLSNAVQFSKRHGTIRVQMMREPGYVVCSIRDEGPGLAREQQDRLFLRPIPSSGPPHSEPQIGVGLAVAKHFVDRMEGDLWCESEPGHGACFSFRLPALE